MRFFLIISVFTFSACFVAEAQLLEDSQNRLKTKKVKSKGFLFFRNKKNARSTSFLKSDRKHEVNPRYSSAPPRSGDKRPAPRTIRRKEGGKRPSASPRYSKQTGRFQTKKKYITRSSPGSPFKGPYKTNPRYSTGTNRFLTKNTGAPRYSPGSPFRGAKWKVNPRTSEFKHRFDVSPKTKYPKFSTFTSNYRGDLKIKRKKLKDQHPSSNYHFAMKFRSRGVRELLRKWNIFWVRLNGNKLQPDGVSKPVKKPKFDKKERVLWNN